MIKKDQESFLKKLSVLLGASIPLEEAIVLSMRYCKGKNAKKEAEMIHKGVVEGCSLSAMFSHSGVWNRTTIALTRVGELSGSLGTYLKEAGEIIKEEREEKTKMLGALIYPMIVGVLAFFMIVFLISFVFPKITPLFEGMKGGLPWSTRVVIFTNKVIMSYGLIALSIFVIAVVTGVYLVRISLPARCYLERILLSFPVIGRLFQLSILRQSAFLLGSLLVSGMAFEECLQLIIESQSFISTRSMFERLLESVRSGSSFSACLANESLFYSWTDMVLIGERSGRLSEMFIQLSLGHKSDMDDIIASATKLIEPILMIVIGGVVGLIALSIITPMYSLTQYVH